MALVSLRAAILGFLDIEPATGYTLQARFEGSVGAFWSVTQSQIYRELHALEKAKCVSCRVEAQDGKPSRKIYKPTKRGLQELTAWLQSEPEPVQLRHTLLLKFVFSEKLPPVKICELLLRYETKLAAIRAEYVRRQNAPEIFELARSETERTLWELSLEHGLLWVETEIQWCIRARKRLSKTKE